MAKEDWDDVARTCRDMSVGLKGITVSCFVCAGVLTIFGTFIVNGQSWWADRPFLINLLSSLTVALIGVPIGLIFMKVITARQDQRIGALSAYRLARAAARELHERALGLAGGVSSMRDLVQLLIDTQSIILWCTNELNRSDGRPSRDLDTALRRASDRVNEANRAFRALLPAPDSRAELELEDRWRYWDTFVRPKLLSADLHELTNGTDALGYSLQWKEPFANVQRTTLDIERCLEDFRRGGLSPDQLKQRLSSVQEELRAWKDAALKVSGLVEFATQLVEAIATTPETDVCKGVRKRRRWLPT